MAKSDRQRSPEQRAIVGARIKIAAATARLTLKQLAARVGVSSAAMYQYVRGITGTPDAVLDSIARETGVDRAFFDPDASEPPPSGGASVISMRASVAAPPDLIRADLRRLEQLAEAMDNPRRNLPGLVSVHHEMLALARVAGDRNQEAYVLWRLGAVHNDAGGFEEAEACLRQARDLFRSTGAQEYEVLVALDLAQALAECGRTEAAIACCHEVASQGSADLRWRALVNLGGLHYRRREREAAMRAFADAAAALECIDARRREAGAMPYMMAHLAKVARDTGHYEAAMSLWSRSLAQATEEKQAGVFLESLISMAEVCQLVGKISEARHRLEQAVVLASLWFDDQNRQSIARAHLAEVMAALGCLDEAREHARASLKTATRVGGPRGMILASLALCETCLAAGQLREALDYANDAIREADAAGRSLESAQGRICRARVCLHLAGQGDGHDWLAEARRDAGRVVEDAATRDAPRERMAAHLTLAQCLRVEGRAEEAEEAVEQALQIARDGAPALPVLLGFDPAELPSLMRTAPLDLESLFARRSVTVPALEWQAHYLQGSLKAKRLGPAAGYIALREAALALGRVLDGLSAEDAARFCDGHPEVASVYEDLVRCALTDAEQREALALLRGVRRPGDRTSTALPA
ncbi:MAG TPA: helix-turn-helix transcriptional regulator [Chthonomonadales bacterium]|nr:helix-turn-helix transcriptional regulator [Chthonomonadales bacterium]